ncbi:hypothetical protein [Demequina sp.]|uniref:hypothetical protein n=1 Tax=Demequina sp. TaxID=2050685 RepID=UPI003A84B6B7
MADLSDAIKALGTSRARDRIGAQARPEVMGRIRGRRRRAGMAYGGVTAVAAVALTVTGLAMAPAPTPAPTASPTPVPSLSSALEYATIDLTSELAQSDALQLPSSYGCGKPVPAPDVDGAPVDGAFTVTYDGAALASQGLTGGVEGTLDISSSFDGPTRVWTTAPSAMLVRDGVVVGRAFGGTPREDTVVDIGWGPTLQYVWPGYAYGCGEDESWIPLEAGQYDLVLVARIDSTMQLAAIETLEQHSIVLLPPEMQDYYQPGSWECERMATSDMYLPISCGVARIPGASLDLAAGTATIPFEPSGFEADFSATFVSEPVTVTVAAPEVVEEEAVEPDPYPAVVEGTVPVCGQPYSYFETSEVAVTDGNTMTPGEGKISLGLWLDRMEWDTATIDVAASGELWLLTSAEIPQEDGSSVWTTELAGVASITVPGDRSVDLVRFDGPASIDLEVGPTQWCEGYTSAHVTEAYYAIHHTLTDEHGSRDIRVPLWTSWW